VKEQLPVLEFSDPEQLRDAAKRKAQGQLTNLQHLSNADREKLLQELQIHQIELEIQNEELRDAQSQLEFTRQQYIDLYNLAPVGYASLDDAGLVWRTNSTLCRLLDIDPDAITGRALADFMEDEDREKFLGRFTAFARKPEGKHIDVRFNITAKDSSKHRFTGRIQGRRIAALAPHYGLKIRKQETLLVIISDVTELKKSEEQIEYQAFHDVLTDLPNRANLQDRLEMSLAHAHRHHRFGTLLFMDLDRFKNVNDSLGHHVGDELLVQFASRLRDSTRKEDLLVRMGGDEFVILLAEQSGDRGKAAVSGQKLAQSLIESLAEPFTIANHSIKTSVSIGITIFPFHEDDDVIDVIREADTAMYQAKNLGRNQAAFFHSDMQKRASLRLTMETELRTAIEQNQFELYYQPQIDTQGNMRAIEALLRWHHPTKGIVLPNEFIPIVEETGLIDPLGQLVLEQACEQLNSWISEGIFPSDATMAVNVSAKQFQVNHISDKVKETLRKHDIPPSKLVLEITESLLLPDDHHIHNELDHLASLGVILSIDDFGTGFSSLSVLQNAPIGQLKIDRRFINNLERDTQDAALVRAIISLGQELVMEVVAEGVETKGQRAALEEMDCDLLQGFLISHPIPAKKMTKKLKALSKPKD
jgi:diguanylate cyclase (GGDEF)-like protein